jgi:transcriptional regulator with XRE-family HTH domain
VSRLFDQLREAIEASPKSRYAISKESGVSQSQLSQFLDGTKGLSIDAAERVAEALGLEVALRRRSRRRGR